VLFADMLGFEGLLESKGADLENLVPIYKSAAQAGTPLSQNLLRYRFDTFHRCMNAARDNLQLLRKGTLIMFSDSAFIQLDSPIYALQAAGSLMVSFIRHKVPVRMGLARGSFRALRFMNDVSADLSVHASQFLGTAVSRAVRAEKCGGKGLRVFLDRSFSSHLSEMPGNLALPVPLNGVQYEYNYLSEINMYEPAHRPGSEVSPELLVPCLETMAETAGVHLVQYVETYQAWSRMMAAWRQCALPVPNFMPRA
jgi:hypothetical protein